jgi:hypothetical protein
MAERTHIISGDIGEEKLETLRNRNSIPFFLVYFARFTVSHISYTVSIAEKLVNDELERMWKQL